MSRKVARSTATADHANLVVDRKATGPNSDSSIHSDHFQNFLDETSTSLPKPVSAEHWDAFKEVASEAGIPEEILSFFSKEEEPDDTSDASDRKLTSGLGLGLGIAYSYKGVHKNLPEDPKHEKLPSEGPGAEMRGDEGVKRLKVTPTRPKLNKGGYPTTGGLRLSGSA